MKTLRRIIAGAALAAAVAVPLLTPAPAEAWWHGPGWGWHAGWGWHPGWGWGWGWRPGIAVGVAVPPVVVGAPAYPAYPYGYHWVPGHYAPNGVWVAPHWGYY